MIKIEFEIEDFPDDRSQPYSLVAGVEGRLSIVDEARTFFDEPGILLLEFCRQLEAWIKSSSSGSNMDFYYASMDFEEEPILAFSYQPEEDLYNLSSVWEQGKMKATKDDLVNSCKIFINELNSTIQKKCNER